MTRALVVSSRDVTSGAARPAKGGNGTMGFIEKQGRQDRTARDGSGQRPPGAVAEAVFQAECIQCDDCASVCPQQAIRQDSGGYPYLAAATACSSCGLCADICMHNAIVLTAETQAGLKALMALDNIDIEDRPGPFRR